jgi:hypothetical protein
MKPWVVLSIGLCVAVIAVAPALGASNAVTILWIEIAALAMLMIIVGASVTGRFLGILINDRNIMSLTRFQAVLWTVLILADLATILLGRAWNGGVALSDAKDLVNPALRPDLLMLMGISYVSAVGSSIVSANKSGVPTPQPALEAAKTNLGDNAAQYTEAQGVLYKNKKSSDAQISDLFEGDELADAHTADLGKVQMFFFTIVSAVVFLAGAEGALANAGKAAFDALQTVLAGAKPLIPQLPQTLIALMGISHAAYVGNKAVTRTQSQPVVAAQPSLPAPPQQNVVTSTSTTVSPSIQQ